MSCVFEELCEIAPYAQEMLTTTLKNQVTFGSCLQVISNEEVTSNVQTFLNIFSQSEELTEPDSLFYNFCKSFQSAYVDHEIAKVGCYLVLQLKSFVNDNESFIKDIKKVQCTKTYSVPVAVDDVSFHKKFNVTATVNHTGTLDKGHYTAYVTLSNSSSWQFCDDIAVLRSSVEKVNNTSSYICIYKAI